MVNRWGAEAVGTFWLVLGGCGTAVIAGGDVGFLGVALAFGLSVLTAAYAVGHISGGHFNPAVSLGLAVAGRFAWKDLPGYVVAQLVGAVLAAAVILGIVAGPGRVRPQHRLRRQRLGRGLPRRLRPRRRPAHRGRAHGAVPRRHPRRHGHPRPKGFAPIAIGLALTLVHLISIPVTNTSVNPARSFSQALFAGGTAIEQLWLFVLAPLAGAALAGVVYGYLLAERHAPVPLEEAQEG